MTVAAFATSGSSYPVFDGILGLSLIMHSHFGVCLCCFTDYFLVLGYLEANEEIRLQFDQALIDYVHKRKFPKLAPVATWSLRGATVAAAVGVFQFNTNDIGMSIPLSHDKNTGLTMRQDWLS